MTNYYLIENGIITQSADWKFDNNCLETEEQIIRDSFSGQLYLKSEYDELIETDEYLAKVAEQEAHILALKCITKRQLLIWLYTQKGKTEDDILNAIDTIQDSSQKYLAKVNYNGTNNFYYGNDFVPVIGQALGLSLDDIKTMFDEAKDL